MDKFKRIFNGLDRAYGQYKAGDVRENGKQSGMQKLVKTVTSDECISGQDFVNLLNNLDYTWHKWEGKEITVEVTFKDTNG